VPDPVTRTDVPAYFAPGLSAVGVIPSKAYHIGFIAGGAFEDAALMDSLTALCAQYRERFGLEIDVESALSEATQRSTAQSLLGSGIDFLIIAAEGDQSGIGALCDAQDVPYITMDCRAGTPGRGGYICSIERDDYLVGILTGLSVADTLTGKYGEPRGNIGEIAGAVSDQAAILRSAGLRRALAAYPDIRVVCSVTTEGDTAYHAAVNVMKAYRQGDLDGIVALDDAMTLEALQAAVNYGRKELRGFIWSAGATKDGLTGVWYGELAQTVEVTAQSGMMALEYALQYLEGKGSDIPPIVCGMTRAFRAGTQQKLDAIAELVAQMDALEISYCMDSAGDYSLFAPDERVAEIYPRHYYEYGDAASFIAEFGPFTTGDAVYAPAAQG
jgi:ABC-type sugar transport system substrate-binding protein